MKRINFPIIVLFVVFFVKQISLRVYISPDGDDSNPGTIDEPVKSFPVAINKAQAGDTIYVHQIIRLLIVTLILMLIPDKAMQMALHLNSMWDQIIISMDAGHGKILTTGMMAICEVMTM